MIQRSMRQFGFSVLFALFILANLVQTGWSQLKPESTKKVGPGVEYYSIIDKETPLAMFVMEIDLTDPDITLELGVSNDRLTGNETVRTMSKRLDRDGHRIVGGINGDFWASEGCPVGMAAKNGLLLRSSSHRSVFTFSNDKKPLIDFFDTRITLTTTDGNSLEFKELNSFISGNEPILITSLRKKEIEVPLGNRAIVLAPDLWEIRPNDSIQATVSRLFNAEQKFPVADTEFVFLIPDEKLKAFPEGFTIGDSVKIEIQTTGRFSGDPNNLNTALGGGPRLLKDGEVSVDRYGEMKESFNTTRHPRTALGFNQDGTRMWLVIVDGRRAGHSIGIGLFDLAEKMKQLGAWQAMNLDGGGSSSMVVRNETMNWPSDSSGDRPVTNALLVVSTAPPSPLHYLQIEPMSFEVFPRTPLQLALSGQDTAYNPMDIPMDQVKWEIVGGDGKIDKTGLFTAGKRPGKISIRAKVEGVIGTSFSTLDTWAYGSVNQPKEIRIVPQQITIPQDETVNLKIEGLTHTGEWEAIPSELARWRYPKKICSLSDNGQLTPKKDGRGKLSARFGKTSTETEIIIGPKEVVLLEDFSDVSDWNLTGVRIPLEKCSIRTTDEQVIAGTRSMRIDYNLINPEGVSALYLNTVKPIYREPEFLRFQVYGNACDHLLRTVIKDVDGELFYAESPGAITWKDEWKQIEVSFDQLNPHWSNPVASPNAPYYLEQIYLAEPRTAKKSEGTIYLDDIEVVYPPR